MPIDAHGHSLGQVEDAIVGGMSKGILIGIAQCRQDQHALSLMAERVDKPADDLGHSGYLQLLLSPHTFVNITELRHLFDSHVLQLLPDLFLLQSVVSLGIPVFSQSDLDLAKADMVAGFRRRTLLALVRKGCDHAAHLKAGYTGQHTDMPY